MSANQIHRGEPLIRVQDLGKSFGSIDVLKGITVDIYKGDVVFVVGQIDHRPLHEFFGGAYQRSYLF